MNRRNFLQSSMLAATSLSLGWAPSLAATTNPKKVLVLGGTGYFGPVLVQALIDRGHQVTLFNRGVTNPHLFPQLRKIRGDRKTQDRSGLDQLKTSCGQWDWVVDTWQDAPRCVLDTVSLLKDRTRRYQYVSTLSVYDRWDDVGITETAVLNPLPDMQDSVENIHRYAIRKTLAEQAVRDVVGNRGVMFRSHGMRGERKREGSLSEPYWPVRLARGGDVMVPADAEYCQMTDMVSMARFMVHCGEQAHSGPYNVAYQPMLFRDYIQGIVDTTGSEARLHWVPQEFLAEFDVHPYEDIPMWRMEPKGAYRFSVQRALDHGLVNRPHSDLIQDQLKGYYSRHPADDFAFGGEDSGTISSETERSILQAWMEQSD